MKQVIFSRTLPPQGATFSHSAVNGRQFFDTDGFPETMSACPWAAAGTWRNLVCRIPGTTQDHGFLLRKNFADTLLACSTSLADPTGMDLTHVVTNAVGDYMDLGMTGLVDGNKITYTSVTFQATTPGVSVYALPDQTSISATAYNDPYVRAAFNRLDHWGGLTYDAGTGVVKEIAPTAVAGSVIRYVFVLLDPTLPGDPMSPGTGKSCTIVLAVAPGGPGAFVIQDGSGGTPDTRQTITDAQTVFDMSFDLPVEPGSLVALYASGDFVGSRRLVGSVAFLATDTTQYQLCGDGAIEAGYPPDVAAWGPISSSGDSTFHGPATAPTPIPENTMVDFLGPDPIYMQGLRIILWRSGGTGPGTDQFATMSLRKNEGDPAGAPSVTLTDAQGIGTDLVRMASFTSFGDEIDLQIIGSADAEEGRWLWGMGVSDSPPAPPAPVTYAMRRLRRFPLPWDENNRRTVLDRIEFLVQPGQGLPNVPATTQGYDPQYMIRLSKDGGITWGPIIYMTGSGKSGEYWRRVFLNKLGQGRNWVVEITDSDPVFSALINCTVNLSPGSN